MNPDDTICVKKESKIEFTSPVQDKMDKDDIGHIKREFMAMSPSPI